MIAWLRRVGGDAAKDEAFEAGGVGCAEERADVVHAANMVEQDNGWDSDVLHQLTRIS